MYGVVDNLRNLSKAMDELLPFLPEDFVWPTIVGFSPFQTYLEWGVRDDAQESERGSVWITVGADGIKMNADFRPDWPECGATKFDAELASQWLKELTKNWQWGSEPERSLFILFHSKRYP